MEPSDCQGSLLETGLKQGGKQRGGPRKPDAAQRDTSPGPGVHGPRVTMQSPRQPGSVTRGAVEGSWQAAPLRTGQGRGGSARPEADPSSKNPH